MSESIATVEKMPPNVQEILRLRARVAELTAVLQPFTDPDNAPLMILGDAHMAKLVDDARAVLGKGSET